VSRLNVIHILFLGALSIVSQESTYAINFPGQILFRHSSTNIAHNYQVEEIERTFCEPLAFICYFIHVKARKYSCEYLLVSSTSTSEHVYPTFVIFFAAHATVGNKPIDPKGKLSKQHRKMHSMNASIRTVFLLITMASTTSAALRGIASGSESSSSSSSLVHRDLMSSVNNENRGGAAGRTMASGGVFNVRMDLPQGNQGGEIIVTTPSPAKPTPSPTKAPTQKPTVKPAAKPTTAAASTIPDDGNRCPSSESKPFWDLAKYSGYAVPCTSNKDCVDYETQFASTWGLACCNYPQCLCAVNDPADKDIQCLTV
jgi:hypothetical protein